MSYILKLNGADVLSLNLPPCSHISSPYITGFDTKVIQQGENRQLVTDVPVEFQKYPIQIQGFRKITDQSRGIYRISLNVIKKTRKMSTCNRFRFETIGSRPIVPKNLPRH